MLSEVLPVVEFKVEDGVSDQEAKDLIEAEPPLTETKETKQKDPFKEKPLIDVCFGSSEIIAAANFVRITAQRHLPPGPRHKSNPALPQQNGSDRMRMGSAIEKSILSEYDT